MDLKNMDILANQSKRYQLLQSQNISDDLEKIVKRFPLGSNEVIELLASHDTLIKKLMCDYIVDRSVKDSELSLLTANLLMRDTSDANPSVRCASLLALSTLPEMEDAAISSVSKSMSDPSAQVRRVSALCCINIHRHSPDVFLESGLVNQLYEGIRDSDPIVITNCLLALEEVLQHEGSVIINKNIANFLIQNISLFSHCSLVYVLNILTKYTPKSENEMLNILNNLDCCFTSNTPSVLVASTQLFLHLVKDLKLTSDLYATLKAPICKILSQNIHEAVFLLINFLKSIQINLSASFGDCYKKFLLRNKDPSYLKKKKFEILPLLATDINVKDIICEVQHYTLDYQSFDAAFQCLAILGTLNGEALFSVYDIITVGLKSPNDKVIISALECFLKILVIRSNVELDKNKLILDLPKNLVSTIFTKLSTPVLQENYPVVVLYLFQNLAPALDNVQLLLEQLFKLLDSWDLETQCLFVTTAAIVFLYQPAQAQPILSIILSKLHKTPKQQLRNHAAFIYAVLEEGPDNAKKILIT